MSDEYRTILEGVIAMEERNAAQFISECRIRELEEVVNEFHNDLSDIINEMQIESKADYRNIVLRACAKSILIVREVVTLCSSGYPDGALSLARNLYEQFIILAFLESKKSDNDFEKYVSDYFTDYEIQMLRLDREIKEAIGDEREVESLTSELNSHKEKAQHSYSNRDYWWSGLNSFRDIAKAVSLSDDVDLKRFFDTLLIYYKRACIALHANCIGNTMRLGCYEDISIIDASPTKQGHGLPLSFSTISFIYIVGVTCNMFCMDFDKYKERLNVLVEFYQGQERSEQKLLTNSVNN